MFFNESYEYIHSFVHLYDIEKGLENYTYSKSSPKEGLEWSRRRFYILCMLFFIV